MWCVVCAFGAPRVRRVHTMLIRIVPSQTHLICPCRADVPATPALASLLSHVACPLIHHTMPATPTHLSVTPMKARPPHGDQPVFSPANNPFTSLLPLRVTCGPPHIPPALHATHVRQRPLQHELWHGTYCPAGSRILRFASPCHYFVSQIMTVHVLLAYPWLLTT